MSNKIKCDHCGHEFQQGGSFQIDGDFFFKVTRDHGRITSIEEHARQANAPIVFNTEPIDEVAFERAIKKWLIG